MSTRLDNLRKMQEKYEDGGHAAAALRVAHRIKEVEREEAAHAERCQRAEELAIQSDLTGRADLLADAIELHKEELDPEDAAELHRRCDGCNCYPCQCDALYEKGMDREMFGEE